MLLSITTTHQPATDLGWLLHKHPAKVQEFKLGSYGKVHIVYPEATEKRCTATMLLDIDPITLARGNSWSRGNEGFTLQAYVNDRPYVASSFLSHAIANVYGSALNGTCKDRPELLTVEMPFEVKISALPSRGGEKLIRTLFEPLGYQIEAERFVLDESFPDWGNSRYFKLTLRNTLVLQDLLSHLFILIPVLDGQKHYFVDNAEIEKLMEKGKRWLPQHPEKEQITRRYLKFRKLGNKAMEYFEDEAKSVELDGDKKEEQVEKSITSKDNKPLNVQRIEAVLEQVRKCGATSVLDLGCGEGRYLNEFMKSTDLEQITGIDVAPRTLMIAKKRLYYDRMTETQQKRIALYQGSLLYRDERLENHDAAILIEVIEHVEPSKHALLERTIFECAKPKTVIVTTPNSDFNVLFPNLPHGKFRHPDHRFEWSRKEFAAWAKPVAEQYGYSVCFHPVGPIHEKHGAPTQMAVFHLIKS